MFCVALWCPLIKISVINFCLSPNSPYQFCPPWPSPVARVTTNCINYSEAELALKQKSSSLSSKYIYNNQVLSMFLNVLHIQKVSFHSFNKVTRSSSLSCYQLSISIRAPTRHPSSLSPLSGSSQTKINQKLPADNYRGVWSTRVIFSVFQNLNLNGLQFSIYGSGLNC